MCLPTNTDQPSSAATRSIVGLGILMFLACAAGPVITGAIGALGVGALAGVGGVVFALALCAVVPVVGGLLRRRADQPASDAQRP